MAPALEEYLAATMAGTAPPREEFLARYPELADDLDACLEAIRFIGKAAEGPRSVAAEAAGAASEPAPGQLGDFRIRREVGRGGMGVVYEAEQLSLGRRVALKVLPFAATMDPRHLQRFHNEARAAASLHHEHIVPVYAVGQERGVHYYAMQFIDGQTLAELIRGQRGPAAAPPEAPTVTEAAGRPSADTAPVAAAPTSVTRRERAAYRHAATLIAQAAEALEHAHAQGVVHRDVKPANLLLDGQGKLWVADFGLARLGTDAGVTLTGDLLGTLRYMSPEQALARHGLVDHRTDIYALGATLYELLTLQPAVDGNDREELLRQIMFEEPRPPRRLDKGVPVELETIVLKALEKNPAERYATAQELADDLHRFLKDEPVRAQPAGVVRRLRKWGRRHQAVVWSAALIALIFSASLGWILGDRQARRAEAERQVEEALGLAEARLLWGNPHDPELITAARKAEAQLASGLVRMELRQRVEWMLADLMMLARVEEIRLDQASVKEGHFDLGRADPAYARAFREYGIDVEALTPADAGARMSERAIALHLAAAMDSWAMARWEGEKWGRFDRDQVGKERGPWKRLLEVAQVVDPDPWRCSLRKVLANDNGRKAALERLAVSAPIDALPPPTVFEFAAALRLAGAHGRAVEVLRRGQERYPADFWINHELAITLAEKMKPPRLDEALGCYRAALALRPDSPGVHLNFGSALKHKGQLDQAIAAFRAAIRLKEDYGGAYLNLGIALHDKGQLDEAIACFQKTIELKKDYYIEAHNSLGAALKAKGQVDQAIALYRKAIDLDKDAPYPHYNLGQALRAEGRVDEAIAEYRKAIAVQKDYPNAHRDLGNALAEKGQFDEAITALREAVRLNNDDANNHRGLGNALRHKGQLNEALAELRKAIHLNNDDATSHSSLGLALAEKGELDAAIAELRKAIAIDPRQATAHVALGEALADKNDVVGAMAELQKAIDLDPKLGVAHGVLGEVLLAQGHFAEARAATLRSLELLPQHGPGRGIASQQLQKCERLIALDGKLPPILSGKEQPADAGQWAEYARVCEKKRLYAATARLYREAIAAKPDLVASPLNGVRYNAACAAALAGWGQGKDAAGLDAKERGRLRLWALDWLKRELQDWQRLLEQEPAKAGPIAGKRMRHWLQDADFSGVRGTEALAKLPEGERRKWQQLWADVAATLARSQGKAVPQPRPEPK
jgi:tetratricopeptide (TPR) repeat protein/serine/threonine protein kinase